MRTFSMRTTLLALWLFPAVLSCSVVGHIQKERNNLIINTIRREPRMKFPARFSAIKDIEKGLRIWINDDKWSETRWQKTKKRNLLNYRQIFGHHLVLIIIMWCIFTRFRQTFFWELWRMCVFDVYLSPQKQKNRTKTDYRDFECIFVYFWASLSLSLPKA